MDVFEPELFGYSAKEVRPNGKGWIIESIDLPVIACGNDDLWYCPVVTEVQPKIMFG